ncbi:N-acetylmuramoyl-L-alanine amidase [Thermomonas sp.]|uniref:N-acetylmuramoyl-L-alanine amidase n=1 Tax=Thermomonas sp. TaxID=1971895 RepID=UPI003D09FA2F
MKGSQRQPAVAAAIGLVALALLPVKASEIRQLRIESGPTGTRAELHLDTLGEYRLIPLSNPERLAVDFPDSHLARGLALPGAAGMVKAVRTGQPVPGTLRVVFDLAGKVKAIPTTLGGAASGAVLVLEWPGDGPAPVQAVASAPAPAAPSGSAAGTAPGAAPNDPIAAFAQHPLPASASPGPASAPTPALAAAATASAAAVVESVPTPADPPLPPPPRPALQAGMRPLVVAIDAGHGGQDPGARGPGGTREKDVTLAIARELARQVNATPGLKAYLTRDSDVFIPLEYRARRASANKADIFISIHADAAENHSARGSSVYILSTRGASSQRARWLADKENAADVIGGARVRVADNTLTSVLLDLTQSGNMKASEDAAQHVLGGLKRVGNNHKPDIERANFAVLRTSDKMPAMLVETAFISNPEEEKRLTDPAFQRTLARAILDGVDTYFSRQPPPGTLYAARAQAAQSAQAMDVPRSGIGGSR